MYVNLVYPHVTMKGNIRTVNFKYKPHIDGSESEPHLMIYCRFKQLKKQIPLNFLPIHSIYHYSWCRLLSCQGK